MIFTYLSKAYPNAGVKISKTCQGPFGPIMSYFRGPSQSFKGPDFLISLGGLITVLLSPLKFAGPAGPLCVNFEGPHASLRAIGPRARLILTPANVFFSQQLQVLKNEKKRGFCWPP